MGTSYSNPERLESTGARHHPLPIHLYAAPPGRPPMMGAAQNSRNVPKNSATSGFVFIGTRILLAQAGCFALPAADPLSFRRRMRQQLFLKEESG